jgi:hypothetical protein
MRQIEKCKPRYPFLADRKLVEENSGARMTSEISDLSLTGCYVDTINPLPDETLVHLRIFTEAHVFLAPATVVQSQVFLGMGRKFREVQRESLKVLRLWLPEAPEQPKEAQA